jgi:Rps23 Pro-64 3,4-dihydroxylase Tpa1-like proline 4-hydroxylase
MFKTTIIDNFLNDKQLLQDFFDSIQNGKMKLSFTNYGIDQNHIDSFTSAEDETNFFIPCVYDIYKKVSEIHEQNFKHTNSRIYRWHLNVHPTGYDGDIHTDSHVNGLPTYLYFAVPHWEPRFGGEFIVYDDNNLAEEVVSFVPDRLVIFNGHKPHRGVGPTRLSTLLRISLAFQTELINNQQEEK